MADLTQTLKDAAYIGIGFGVIGVQKAMVARADVAKQLTEARGDLETQLTDVRSQVQSQVEDAVKLVETQLGGVKTTVAKAQQEIDLRLEPVVKEIEGRLDVFEAKLPEQVQAAFKQARTAAKDAEKQLRSLVAA